MLPYNPECYELFAMFIKTDKDNTCKTCGMLITSPEFTSNLTGKTYYTKSFDPLECSTKNVIYGIKCCILESKSLKVSCNVLCLEAFLTFGC
jgi:hypothetical protein